MQKFIASRRLVFRNEILKAINTYLIESTRNNGETENQPQPSRCISIDDSTESIVSEKEKEKNTSVGSPSVGERTTLFSLIFLNLRHQENTVANNSRVI